MSRPIASMILGILVSGCAITQPYAPDAANQTVADQGVAYPTPGAHIGVGMGHSGGRTVGGVGFGVGF